MASSTSLSSSSTSSSPHHRSRFGDTTLTKVFVGGLPWETPTEELKKYFDQFGEILEAVVITDKSTGRSKGYGFVTFRDAEAARRSVEEPNPVIDGRRANCNIAALGRPRLSPPRGKRRGAARMKEPVGAGRAHPTVTTKYCESGQHGSLYQSPPQPTGPPQYSRLPTPMTPSPIIYQTPYGYVTYSADYGYQQAVYGPQVAPHYYQQMYGATSPQNVGPPSPYPYYHFGYPMQSPRGSYPSPTSQGRRQQQQQVFVQDDPPAHAHSEGSLVSSSFQSFVHLQPSSDARQPMDTSTDPSAAPQPSTPEGTTDQSPTS